MSLNTRKLSGFTSEYFSTSPPNAPAPGAALDRKASNNMAMEPLFTDEFGLKVVCDVPGIIPALAKPLMALRASSDTAPISVKP